MLWELREKRSQLRQPSEMVWHRGIRPSWGVRTGAAEGQVCSSWCNTATFLTDVSDSDDGGTFLLSGSHVIDGARLLARLSRRFSL